MSEASTAQSDVREDELQTEKLEECIEILVAAGYHRARVKGLDNFDKIVGGLVWGLSKCHIETKMNILYEENSTIKQRINTTEAIVEALISITCPHKIEPHQIQGLDYIHIFPVLQWLINKAVQFEVNDDQVNYFGEWFGKYDKARNQENYIEHARIDFMERLRGVYEFEDETTVRDKKRSSTAKILNLEEDVKCTIAEYIKKEKDGGTLYTTKKVETEIERPTGDGEPTTSELEESSAKPRVSTKIVREMMENAMADVYKDESENDRIAREKMEKTMEEYDIRADLQKIEKLIEKDAMEYLQARAENDATVEEADEVSLKFKRDVERRDVKKLSDLIDKVTEAKARSKWLRESTKQELNDLKSQVMAMRLNLDSSTGITKGYDPKLRDAMYDLEEERLKRANTAREVVYLQQKLDKSLTDTLKTQYYNYEIEKANDIYALSNEMKRLLIEHNTAVDILNFSTKVLSFTNKIEETILNNQMSEKYRDAFISYMNDVRAQLAEYHWKGKLTQEKMLEEKKALGLRHKELQRSHRIADDASEHLQNMILINQRLNEYNATLDRLEKTSCKA